MASLQAAPVSPRTVGCLSGPGWGLRGLSLSGWNLWGLGDLWRTAVYFIGKMQDSSLRSDWVDCNV